MSIERFLINSRFCETELNKVCIKFSVLQISIYSGLYVGVCTVRYTGLLSSYLRNFLSGKVEGSVLTKCSFGSTSSWRSTNCIWRSPAFTHYSIFTFHFSFWHRTVCSLFFPSLLCVTGVFFSFLWHSHLYFFLSLFLHCHLISSFYRLFVCNLLILSCCHCVYCLECT